MSDFDTDLALFIYDPEDNLIMSGKAIQIKRNFIQVTQTNSFYMKY